MLQALYVFHEFQSRCVEDVADAELFAIPDIFAALYHHTAHSECGGTKKILPQRDAIAIAAVHMNDRINALLKQYRRGSEARHMHLGGICQLHGIDCRGKDFTLLA